MHEVAPGIVRTDDCQCVAFSPGRVETAIRDALEQLGRAPDEAVCAAVTEQLLLQVRQAEGQRRAVAEIERRNPRLPDWDEV